MPVHGKKTFEELKLTNEHGAEYWSACDLQPLLGYTQWRRFEQAIERDRVGSQAHAIQTHERVGKEVRDAQG